MTDDTCLCDGELMENCIFCEHELCWTCAVAVEDGEMECPFCGQKDEANDEK